jgi:hypothetical protein
MLFEKYFNETLDNRKICCTFALTIPRGGAVVARWAHNPKVGSSSLSPATKMNVPISLQELIGIFLKVRL